MNNYLLTVVLVSALLVACGDTGRQLTVPTAKSNTGSSDKPGSPSGKIQQEALKAGVLLQIQPRSLNISEMSNSEVTMGLRFLLNQSDSLGFRKYNFNVLTGEELTLDNSQNDLTPDSRLKIELYRFKNMTPAKDMLAIQFQFESRERSEAEREESSLVMIVELNKSKKDPIKANFFYPTPENFNLKKWADDSVKDSKPQ